MSMDDEMSKVVASVGHPGGCQERIENEGGQLIAELVYLCRCAVRGRAKDGPGGGREMVLGRARLAEVGWLAG